MREEPAVRCEECGEAMARSISGGGAVYVRGGKVSGDLRRAADERFHSGLARAREAFPWMKKGPQPAMTPQMFREEPAPPHSPAPHPPAKDSPAKNDAGDGA